MYTKQFAREYVFGVRSVCLREAHFGFVQVQTCNNL